MRKLQNAVSAGRFVCLFVVALTILSFHGIVEVQASTILNSFNSSGVSSGPSSSAVFSVSTDVKITKVMTYHYNNGNGSTPGTIALKHSDGTTYGPWSASGTTQNQYWTVIPNVTIKAGTYTVVDSNTTTWSYNSSSKNAGFVQIEGDVVTTSSSSVSSSMVGDGFDVTADASGSPSALKLSAKLKIGSSDVGKNGQIFVAVVFANKIFMCDGKQWLEYTGGSIPVYASIVLASSYNLQLLTGQDVSALAGLSFFVGYGTNADEMIKAIRIGQFYTIPSSSGGTGSSSSGNSSGGSSSDTTITGPGGTILNLPTGSSSSGGNISLTTGDSTGLVKSTQKAVSNAIKVNVKDATYVSGDASYKLAIPLTSPVNDPDKLALSVKLTSGSVVPILGEYDQTNNAYKIELNGLTNGWNMQVVEEPQSQIIKGPKASGKTVNWATTTNWNPCDAWVFRMSAPPSAGDAIDAAEVEDLKSTAVDLCQKYSAMGFREPQMFISSRYGGRVVNIAYNVDGSYYSSSSVTDVPPLDEIQLRKLGQIVIDYATWKNVRYPKYGWLLKNTLAHELFHGVQWGYDTKFSVFTLNGDDYISLKAFTEGTATTIGMTYQQQGSINGPNVWLRNGSPGQDTLDSYGASYPFDGSGYSRQDFFAYVAKAYGGGSFKYLVDLFEELSKQSKSINLTTSSIEDEISVYRKAMDTSFTRSFKSGLGDIFMVYAMDRAYHITDVGELRDTDKGLTHNKLRADLFKVGVPSSGYTSSSPYKSGDIYPLSARAFRIPSIPDAVKTKGKLPMTFSISDGSLGADKFRIYVIPEAAGIAKIDSAVEISVLDKPVDIPVTGIDSLSVFIASVNTVKQSKMPNVSAYADFTVTNTTTTPTSSKAYSCTEDAGANSTCWQFTSNISYWQSWCGSQTWRAGECRSGALGYCDITGGYARRSYYYSPDILTRNGFCSGTWVPN